MAKSKTFIGAFVSFATKYAGEARDLSGALSTIVGGIGLPRNEREKVEETIKRFSDAADNIEKGVKALGELPAVSVNSAQLDAAVRRALPDFIGGLSEAALRELLEKKKST